MKKIITKWAVLVLGVLALSAVMVIAAVAQPGASQTLPVFAQIRAAVPGNSGDFKPAPPPADGKSKPAATVDAPDPKPTPRPSTRAQQATLPFGELPSKSAPGIFWQGENTETVNGVVQGRTTIFSDNEYDPGPEEKVVWFRVQEPNSDLKPIWEGRGWWLGPWKKKTVQIDGASATLAGNVDAGTFEGKPFRQTWLETSWIKNGKEYQMLGINIAENDFIKMAGSVK